MFVLIESKCLAFTGVTTGTQLREGYEKKFHLNQAMEPLFFPTGIHECLGRHFSFPCEIFAKGQPI